MVADGAAHGQGDQPDMGADIQDAALAATGLDAAAEAAVMAAAPVLEVAERELALQQERAISADAMFDRPRRADGPNAGAIEAAKRRPGRSEPLERTMAKLAKGGDDRHSHRFQ